MAVLGVSVGMMAVVEEVWVLLVLMFANGLTQIPINSSLSAMVQASVTDEVRGRVAAGFEAVISAADLVSMLMAGVLVGLIGTRSVFALSGLVVLGAAGFAVIYFRWMNEEASANAASAGKAP